MKITKQLLEKMVKEELNEGIPQNMLGALGIAGTVAGIGAAIDFDAIEQRTHDYQVEILDDALQNMDPEEAQKRAQAVLDGEDKSIPADLQAAFDEAAQNYLNPDEDLEEPRSAGGYTDEPQSPWHENKSRLEQLIAEELKSALGERTQVSQKDFKNMSARDALRASGGDDKALRKAIGDFVALGSPDRVSELAQAIEDYQYSDSYLVNTARDLLAHDIGQKASAGRAEREKLAQQINERLDIIQEELKNVLNEKAGSREHASFSGGYAAGLAQQPEGSEVTDLPPEAMEELSQLMNAPHIKTIQDEERRQAIMNYFIDHLKEKYGV